MLILSSKKLKEKKDFLGRSRWGWTAKIFSLRMYGLVYLRKTLYTNSNQIIHVTFTRCELRV